MIQNLEAFFSDLRQEILAGSVARKDFGLSEFMSVFDRELTGAGVIEGVELCHYRNPNLGVRVDGFWMNDDAGLDLFISDYEGRTELQTLTNTEIGTLYKRIAKFYTLCTKQRFYEELSEASPIYGLARAMYEDHASF